MNPSSVHPEAQGPPPPQVYQPMPQGAPYGQQQSAAGGNATVIINQPSPSSVQPVSAQRMWTSGLMSMCDDMGICLCGWCCPGLLLGRISDDMGESCCLGCIVANAAVILRTKWRTQEHIQGSILDDCLVMTFCWSCGLCQLAREVKAKKNGALRV